MMSAATKPTVYVIPEGKWSTGDVSGCLLLPTGEVIAQHISSSEAWLVRDLTTSFADRRTDLEQRYPDGYEIVVVHAAADIPDDVKAANEAWAAEQPVRDDGAAEVTS